MKYLEYPAKSSSEPSPVNTTVTFTQIDFRCGGTTVAGSGTLDIYVGPSTYFGNVTNPSLWQYVATVTANVAPSTVASGPVTPNFAMAPGTYGIALKSNAFSHGYTNGVTCTSTTIPGSCSNSTHRARPNSCNPPSSTANRRDSSCPGQR